MTNNSSLDEQFEQICGEYEAYTVIRFIFVLLSSVIATFGFFANIFLFSHFTATSKKTTVPSLYPRVLAILDALLCAVYVLLFGADAAIVYLQIKNLFILYHAYVIPIFVLSRITQLAIPYILIFATLERLAWAVGKRELRPILQRMFNLQGLYTTVTVIMVICIVLRLPAAWAITVYHYPKCDDFFRTKTASAAKWARESVIYYVYDFHLLSITQTMIPFFVLLMLNVIIVKKVSTMSTASEFAAEHEIEQFNSIDDDLEKIDSEIAPQAQRPSLTPSENDQPKSLTINVVRRKASSFTGLISAPKVKSAIYTMVCIVASYLISNTLHLILTVLERSNSDLLKDPEDPELASAFHTTFSDIVSFVYMFTSALRISIYYLCNLSFRTEVKKYLQPGKNKNICT